MNIAHKSLRAHGLRSATRYDWTLLAVLICVAGAVSVSFGQDANWDLQNYHFYNAWAWWNGRIFDRDVAAAQVQTFHNPLFDLPFYAMVEAKWPPRLIAFLLAVPAGVAAFFLFKLLALLFSDLPRRDSRIAIVAAAAIGLTSAMGIATLGTTMNEWPLVALVMPALWLLVRGLIQGNGELALLRTPLIAGVLIGLASGGKLTAATFAVGLCVALLFRGPYALRQGKRNFTEAFTFGIGVLCGVVITLGPWAYQLWTQYENPVFPYGNEYFKSPWWGQYPVLTRQYGPHNLGDWLRFPFDLIGPGPSFVTEVPYRDARFPVTFLLALIGAVAWLSHRVARAAPLPFVAGVSASWRVIAIFVTVSFLLWTAQHSIYRYLVTLDLLTGALIVTLLHRLLRPGYLAGVAIVVAVAIVATTRPADWWHVDFGARWFDVDVPVVEPNALVLITTDAPVGYVLPFLPADARNLGVLNSINAPDRNTKLSARVATIIRDHRGPLYQLTFPAGAGAGALAAYGLQRDQSACGEVRTKLSTSPLELCRLQRDN